MLRRLRLWVARLFSGQREFDRLAALLRVLQDAGVRSYEAEGIKLALEPVRPEQPQPVMPPQRMPTDQELLFGASEEELRKEGLI